MINEDLIDLAHEFGKFNVLVTDFPWAYSNKKTGGNFKSGSVQHYPVMTMEEIATLPIKEILQRDAVVFCWVPVPLTYQAAQSGMFERFGLEFKTKIFWEKEGKLLMGHWFRGQVEECWLFRKGRAGPFNSSKRNVIHTPVRKHSQKPDELFEMVEEECDKCGLNDRLELFARGRPRPGWAAYGNEVDYD
jgi:N6-adenosine-specific RNA methylase IME4